MGLRGVASLNEEGERLVSSGREVGVRLTACSDAVDSSSRITLGVLL